MEGSKLVAAAAEAAAGQQYPAAALYVVATPIGNLADLTLRALHVLALVDAIACEDTRHSAALLRHFAIAKPLIAVHEHNERDAAGVVLARLARGERVAYVSDAGTPAVSDPGAALVAAVRAAGYRVVPIPGASSALAALSAAGDAGSSGFAFVGFLAATRQRANAAPSPRSRAGAGDAGRVRGTAPDRVARRRACRGVPRSDDDAVPRAHQAVRDDRRRCRRARCRRGSPPTPNRAPRRVRRRPARAGRADAAAHGRRARRGARAVAGRAAAQAGGRARRRDLGRAAQPALCARARAEGAPRRPRTTPAPRPTRSTAVRDLVVVHRGVDVRARLVPACARAGDAPAA